jgi:hypothetical protein
MRNEIKTAIEIACFEMNEYQPFPYMFIHTQVNNETGIGIVNFEKRTVIFAETYIGEITPEAETQLYRRLLAQITRLGVSEAEKHQLNNPKSPLMKLFLRAMSEIGEQNV